jgi:hypothetical protein
MIRAVIKVGVSMARRKALWIIKCRDWSDLAEPEGEADAASGDTPDENVD